MSMISNSIYILQQVKNFLFNLLTKSHLKGKFRDLKKSIKPMMMLLKKQQTILK